MLSNMLFLPAKFPLGAVKGSGWGRNNGRYGIEEFLSAKVISLNLGRNRLTFEIDNALG